MRVLHVINQFSHAGAETSLREFVLSTADIVQHGICVLRPTGNDIPRVKGSVLPFIPDNPLSRLSAIKHVTKAIRSFEPDLIHTTLFDANTAGRIAARRFQAPVLTSLVNTPYVHEAKIDRDISEWKRWIVKSTDRFLSRRCTTHFHAITQAVAAEYVRDFGLKAESVTVLARGRSRERLGTPTMARRATVRSALNIRMDQPIVLSVGRQEAQKGHRYLLESIPHLLDLHPSTIVLVAGRPGASTTMLQRLHNDLGLKGHVRFLGHRDDIGDLLAAADLFAFPSLHEGLGGAVLEAMAMNVPVVASDIPALAEVLEQGLAGRLVRPQNPRELADAMDSLLGSPAQAIELAATARRRFESHYSLQSASEGMLGLYEKLLSS